MQERHLYHASVLDDNTGCFACREEIKGEQKRASKGGQIYWARIYSKSAGRSPSWGGWVRMLMVPLGWRQWTTRVPGLTPTRSRSVPAGTGRRALRFSRRAACAAALGGRASSRWISWAFQRFPSAP